MANNESGGSVSSMETMLGSVTSEQVKPCTIFRVPKQLQKSEKEAQVYKPKVVSIGPLHRGTKTELLHMEEIKYHCMLSLLLRTGDARKSFTKCNKAILELDDSVRACYVDDIKFNNYELAKIMLLDGCFLLELLISNAEQSYPDISETLQKFLGLELRQIKSPLSESDMNDAAAEVRNKGEVLSDLKLIENQIPLFVLVCLFHLLFINVSDPETTYGPVRNTIHPETTYGPVRNTIHHLALMLFGCSPSPATCEKDSAHLVELVHSCLTEEKLLTEEEQEHHSITIKTSTTSRERASVKRNYETAPELKCCAARFKAAGIEIKPVQEQSKGMKQSNDVIFFCYTSFTDKTLEILHPLNITEETEILWWNLIAWEQNRITREKYLSRKYGRTSCKFSEFSLLFKDLVCCEHDIKLLKDQNVVTGTNEKHWSNEKLMTFFHTLADGIQIDVSEDSQYVKMIENFNEYSGGCGNSGMVGHNSHKCRRVLTNTWYTIRTWLETLKRDHTPTLWKTIGVIAAGVLLLLTIAQTVLTAISV